jgi:hypothetical protein
MFTSPLCAYCVLGISNGAGEAAAASAAAGAGTGPPASTPAMNR